MLSRHNYPLSGIQAGHWQRRWFYKTGDLVRYNTDRAVSFIGRSDTQIKVHGHRIEMREIEYHLSSHDLLRQSMLTLSAAGIYCQRLVVKRANRQSIT